MVRLDTVLEPLPHQRTGLHTPAYERATPAKKRGISSGQVRVLSAVSCGSCRSHLTVLLVPPLRRGAGRKELG